MESLPELRYFAQSSKRRFSPDGSSSSGFKDVEVHVASLPISNTSKPRSSKQKEVICHEIIDFDLEDDLVDMLIDGEVDRSGKGKEAFSIRNNESGSHVQISNNGTVDDLNSNLFYEEDECIDVYHEDILDDRYANFESYFDHMDIPPGVEVPFPWLPSYPQNNSEVPTTSTSTSSSSQYDLNRVDLSPELSSYQSSKLLKPIQIRDLTTSECSKKGTQAASQHLKGKKFFPHKPVKEPIPSIEKSKTRSSESHVYSIPWNQLSLGATHSSILGNQNGYPKLSMPSNGHGMQTYMYECPKLPLDIPKPPMGLPLMEGSPFSPFAQSSANNQNGGTPIRVEQRNMDEIMQNFDLFKNFDTVEDCSDHHYCKHGSSAKQAPKSWAKRIQEEWKILENDLPDTIFVRVYESRMDLLRAVIIGAEGTPYHDGLFFFDVFFPSSYPTAPPHVHYHSGGLRINPNLYDCGKVCLSLLNTWSGSHKERWIPGVSTMLQVFVSIQGLILNAKPYFNEPGYADLDGTKSGEKLSLEYNENTFIYSLQTMVYNMRRPPKYFEDFVMAHFCKYAQNILVSCKAYLDGARVGSLGCVEDVNESDKTCSNYFKSCLLGFITTLVNTFCGIGARDCEQFLSLVKSNKMGNAAPGPVDLKSLHIGHAHI